MTVKEMIQKLSEYPADKEVYFTLPGSTQYFGTDKLYSTKYGENPCLECDDAPIYEDIEGMADACWDDHYKDMTNAQKDAMIEFSRKAYDARYSYES